jgi:type IV secretion system protein VirB1
LLLEIIALGAMLRELESTSSVCFGSMGRRCIVAYSAAAILALASQCAPTVAPGTVLAIVQTESSGEPFALNVNGGRQPARQSNAADAAATARRYVAAGYSVDLGLGQINSRNMRWLGLTWETVFDPCTNIAALGLVLTANYNAARPGRDPQSALRVALSMYNTGSQTRGFRNGYVARVVGNAGVADAAAPYGNAIPVAAAVPSATTDLRQTLSAENAPLELPVARVRPAPPPSWNVFERAAYDRETQMLAESEGSSI